MEELQRAVQSVNPPAFGMKENWMLITVVKQRDGGWPSEPIGSWKVLGLVRIWHVALQGDVLFYIPL